MNFGIILFIVVVGLLIYSLIRQPKNILNIIQPTLFPPDPLADFSDDELSSAALTLLSPLPSCNDSFFGGTIAQAEAAEIECKKLREKYKDYQPERMRKKIIGWIAYAEREVAERKSDIISQREKIYMDKYRATEAQKRERAMAVLDVLSKNKWSK